MSSHFDAAGRPANDPSFCRISSNEMMHKTNAQAKSDKPTPQQTGQSNGHTFVRDRASSRNRSLTMQAEPLSKEENTKNTGSIKDRKITVESSIASLSKLMADTSKKPAVPVPAPVSTISAKEANVKSAIDTIRTKFEALKNQIQSLGDPASPAFSIVRLRTCYHELCTLQMELETASEFGETQLKTQLAVQKQSLEANNNKYLNALHPHQSLPIVDKKSAHSPNSGLSRLQQMQSATDATTLNQLKSFSKMGVQTGDPTNSKQLISYIKIRLIECLKLPLNLDIEACLDLHSSYLNMKKAYPDFAKKLLKNDKVFVDLIDGFDKCIPFCKLQQTFKPLKESQQKLRQLMGNMETQKSDMIKFPFSFHTISMTVADIRETLIQLKNFESKFENASSIPAFYPQIRPLLKETQQNISELKGELKRRLFNVFPGIVGNENDLEQLLKHASIATAVTSSQDDLMLILSKVMEVLNKKIKAMSKDHTDVFNKKKSQSEPTSDSESSDSENDSAVTTSTITASQSETVSTGRSSRSRSTSSVGSARSRSASADSLQSRPSSTSSSGSDSALSIETNVSWDDSYIYFPRSSPLTPRGTSKLIAKRIMKNNKLEALRSEEIETEKRTHESHDECMAICNWSDVQAKALSQSKTEQQVKEISVLVDNAEKDLAKHHKLGSVVGAALEPNQNNPYTLALSKINLLKERIFTLLLQFEKNREALKKLSLII